MANSAGTMPNTGRWGWYKDHEGREWRRVSTLIKKVETNSFGLEQWKLRQVLLGAARRDDIVLGVKALGDVPAAGWNEPTKKRLNAWAEDCMQAAGSSAGATNGTAMHDLTERVDRGEPIDQVAAGLPGPAAADLRAYAKLRELNGWRSVEIERTMVCDELEVAGSFDRIDEIPGLTDLLGEWICQHGHNHDMGNSSVIVDVKTEGNPLLNGLHIGPQLAIYSRARRMWLSGIEGLGTHPMYVDAPCVRQDVAIIVHVRDGKAIPYFVDLTAGWEAAQAAYAQLKREQAAKKWFAPVPGVVEPKPAEVLTEVAVAGRYADPERPPSTALATAMLDASRVTATVLGPAPMPAEPLDAEEVMYNRANGLPAYYREPAQTQVAKRGADGLVRWSQTGGTSGPVARVLQLISEAPDMAALGELWQGWTDAGNAWDGEVAAAGEARRRIIECPQAALHTGAGKCACGWSG